MSMAGLCVEEGVGRGYPPPLSMGESEGLVWENLYFGVSEIKSGLLIFSHEDDTFIYLVR